MKFLRDGNSREVQIRLGRDRLQYRLFGILAKFLILLIAIAETLTSCARRDAFANMICKGPPGVKFDGLDTSMIKVGRSSCSRSSIIPTFARISSPECVGSLSDPPAVLFSRATTFPGIFDERFWLDFPTLPRASFSVVIPLKSSRILFRMAAMVCEVDGRAGTVGRCFVGDSNGGEGVGVSTGVTPLGKDGGSSVCRRVNSGRLFFRGGSDGLWDPECFSVYAGLGVAIGGRKGGKADSSLLDMDCPSGACPLVVVVVVVEDMVCSSTASSCVAPGLGMMGKRSASKESAALTSAAPGAASPETSSSPARRPSSSSCPTCTTFLTPGTLGAGTGKGGASLTDADWRRRLEISSWSEPWTLGGRCEVRMLGGTGFMKNDRMAVREVEVLQRHGRSWHAFGGGGDGLGIPAKTVMNSDGADMSPRRCTVRTVGQQPVICRGS